MIPLLRRLAARVRNRCFDEDLAEELRVHEEMKRCELERSGIAPKEAISAARRALGNVTLMRERSREVWIAPWLETVAQDTRYAVRTLIRQPAFTITAGLALLLAIALNTSLFTLFKAIALEPWPIEDPGRVVRIWAQSESRTVGPSVDEYRFMRQHTRSFSGLVAFTFPGNGARIRFGGRPELYIHPVWASANLFDVFGVRMALGSGFVAQDDQTGNLRSPIVLGHLLWRTYFTSDPTVIGQPVHVGPAVFTVVGVAEPRFDNLGGGNVVDAWMPLSSLSTARPSSSIAWEPSVRSASCCVGVAGRLAPGAKAPQATQELQLLHERFSSAARTRTGRIQMYGTAAMSGPGSSQFALMGVFGAASLLVLVLACANVANLQLARALARRREIATRMSIGAGRGRIVRQLLTEGLVLAFSAGLVAVALAAMLPSLLVRFVGGAIPPHIVARLAPDADVVVFTFLICLFACVAFALAPALQATRLTIPLGAFDRSTTRSMRLPLRSALMATQIAVCTVLLIGAGLATRAVAHAMRFDPGFDVAGVHVVSASLPPDGSTPKQRQDFHGSVLAELEADGGAAVGLASYPPLNPAPLVMSLTLPHEGPLDRRSVRLRPISRDYFSVLGIPMESGRMFESRADGEAVVNESFARAFWPGENPLGRIVNDVDNAGVIRQRYTILGVVRDAHLTRLDEVEPIVFTPAKTGEFVTRGGPDAIERIRGAALATSPAAIITVRPLTDELRKHLQASRTGATIAWGIGVLGLALAIVGVFGVFAYAVEERRREIGIRMALGAAKPQVIRALIASSGRAMLAGLGAGLLGSLVCGPVLRRYLYGLSSLDPAAYALVVAILGIAAVLATFIPAKRALRVDAAVTLRAE